MPESLSKEWIAEQLALCAGGHEGSWHAGNHGWNGSGVWADSGDMIVAPFKSSLRSQRLKQGEQDARSIAAARTGYPLVLRELLEIYQRRCENCQYHHDDYLCPVKNHGMYPETYWSCANWKARKEAADASTD